MNEDETVKRKEFFDAVRETVTKYENDPNVIRLVMVATVVSTDEDGEKIITEDDDGVAMCQVSYELFHNGAEIELIQTFSGAIQTVLVRNDPELQGETIQ